MTKANNFITNLVRTNFTFESQLQFLLNFLHDLSIKFFKTENSENIQSF